MRSIDNLQQVPAGEVISSDDLVEFHASRILLLLLTCGTKDQKTRRSKVEGLTKLAKLDFFVRYPAFFERVAAELEESVPEMNKTLESKMVRYHYGPWDNRYYHVLPYLEAKGLIEIKKDARNNQYKFFLTEKGQEVAAKFAEAEEFGALRENMEQVRRVLGRKSGNQLKNLIYQVFEEEVAERRLGEIIEQ
jgi:DNA-binding PadR family transcriptional regulator